MWISTEGFTHLCLSLSKLSNHGNLRQPPVEVKEGDDFEWLLPSIYPALERQAKRQTERQVERQIDRQELGW